MPPSSDRSTTRSGYDRVARTPGMGVGIGAGLGMAVGVLVGGGLGVAIGLAVGAGVGAAWEARAAPVAGGSPYGSKDASPES